MKTDYEKKKGQLLNLVVIWMKQGRKEEGREREVGWEINYNLRENIRFWGDITFFFLKKKGRFGYILLMQKIRVCTPMYIIHILV